MVMVVVPGRVDLEWAKARGEVYPTPCNPIGGGGEGLRPCGFFKDVVVEARMCCNNRVHGEEGNENIFHHDKDGSKRQLFSFCDL